jgi:hypothetical protein
LRVVQHDRGVAILDKKAKFRFPLLDRLLNSERERTEKVLAAYREALCELVDLRLKLQQIENALHGKKI